MFDGKTFLPVTGIPIRKIDCMMSPLADADPVPLAVAILNANWLMRVMRVWLHRRERDDRGTGVRDLQDEFPHIPRVGRAALGAEPAVQADILVLDHDATRLLQRP